jgi:hypothetical protein
MVVTIPGGKPQWGWLRSRKLNAVLQVYQYQCVEYVANERDEIRVRVNTAKRCNLPVASANRSRCYKPLIRRYVCCERLAFMSRLRS